MRTLVRIIAVATLVVAGSLIGDQGTDRAAAQIDPLDDEIEQDAPGLGNIVGSPEPGPDPTDAGDRGGWAQLVLAVVMFGAVAVFLRIIFRQAGHRPDQPST